MEKFSRYAGGAESYAVSLAEALIKHGWEVHFFGETWDGEPKQAHFHRIHVPKFLPASLKMLLFAWKHKKMVRQQPFDVVIGFGNTIYMNVYQSHGGVHQLSTARKIYAEKSALRRMVKRLLVLLSIKHWSRAWIEAAAFRIQPRPKIIAIAEMIKKDMVSFFRIPPEEIAVVYNGVDTKKYNPSSLKSVRGRLRNQWGVGDDDTVFLFVSYDLKKKGVEPLVEAAAMLKKIGNGNFKIIIVGGQPYRSLEKRIKRLGLEETIIFTGRVKSIEAYYANSDVFVLPTYYDACSLVVIEAMAGGLPAITTVYNGAGGIIRDGINGHIISHPPDAAELAKKMRLLLDKQERKKMSAAAAHAAAQYSAERNHGEIMKILDEARKLKNH